jgi:hypothetical protein
LNNQEAKKILILFRPGSADEKDPFFDEARQLAKTDPELARWFAAHCESYLVLRPKFQTIPVPAGLKEQILSERKIYRPPFQKYSRPLLAAAAVVVLLLGINFGLESFRGGADRYSAYRKRMVETALRSYYMDSTATDPALIRGFLRTNNAPADYRLSGGLEAAALAGCAVSTWQGNPVSMICFKTGRPMPPGDQSDLWLFVTSRKTLSNAPASSAPVFARVNKATTASWSDEQNSYLLAAVGDEALLRKYVSNGP